ncbi:NACHT, LRR and PYD domains-containing protein 3-like [Thamnophis elegans]|uniref:NACHT, LRR and PYD domains-containing protein 3-like n=1 Tax=Thamnophis elegans TaxID=35005 RepID=UPI00137764A6|nr:NACHT, LRR and PYD domains-containing protein 3-like [Thamnophis elegans]
MKDPNAVPGEYVLFNDRYSKLMILDYHPSKEEREHEILAIGWKHDKIIRKKAESSTSIEALFNPDKCGLIPQVVVLKGAAGIGKTIMVKKIMLDWASQKLYQDKFNYVFYICCRKMNLHAEVEKSSIAEIISEGWLKEHKLKNVIQNILKNEEKLLFIIDGFDELKYSFDQPENYFCTDPWKKEPVRILLNSLFQKKLFPKSSLIITTRPTALKKLHQCLERPGYFEILGFSTKEREEYFYNFFENKDQAAQALRFVKQNDTLFTMCIIPLVSWIICTVMKQEMERGKDLQKTPYTLTAIYMLYLSSLLKFHHKESKQDVQTNVKGLCSLAAEGIRKRQILFMEEEVKKHILDQGNSLPLFLNQSIFKRDIDCIQTYSFIHLSFQEFFAALFYVLEEGDEQHSKIQNKNLRTLLETHRSFRTDIAVGFRFLFGFLNEENRMRELKKEFGWEISPKSKELVLDWVKNNLKNSSYGFELLTEIFSYLYETQDDNFIKRALFDITEIRDECYFDMELRILSYCIQHCQCLQKLCVNSFDFPENEDWCLDERNVNDFFKALTQLRNLEDLRCKSNIDEGVVVSLCFCEEQNKSRTRSVLSYRGAHTFHTPELSPGLENWSFKESRSRHLAEVFKNNQRLKELRLYFKDIDDRATEFLFEGLQDPHCKIERLEVHCSASLTYRDCLPFVEQQQPQLDGKISATSCSGPLAKVYKTNQRLGVLELSFKSYDDKTMKLLCDGLNNPECTLKKLKINGEILTESCSRHLAEVLRKNQRLRELYLYINNTDNKAMELLCDGLKHPQCTIETLELAGGIRTESCSRHLAEALRKNQRLRELYLDIDNPYYEVTEVLCDGLKCTIETLTFHRELGFEFCSCDIAKVLMKNQRLRTLCLFLNELDDYSMEKLCMGLKQPECTIEVLRLHGVISSESCSRHLAEVFRKSHRLIELELPFKSPDDKTMELLCGGLNDPECTIKKLNHLNHKFRTE